MGCIYMHTNIITIERYIGQCKGDAEVAEKRRKKAHIRGDGNKPLKEAIDKYGIHNFSFDILHHDVPNNLLDDYEKAAVVKYKSFENGYNRTPDGQSFSGSPESQKLATEAASKKNRGTPRSSETCEKIRKSHIGITHSDETKQLMSKQRKGRPSPNKGKPSPLKGVPRSEETKAKMSKSQKGRKFTDEHCANISAAQTGEKNNNFGKPRSVETCQKIGEANSSPYKSDAYALFSNLPDSMSLKEKRKQLCEKFPTVPYGTVYGWIKQWQPEGVSSLKHSREAFSHIKADAYDIFKTLFGVSSLREIRKIIREKYPTLHKSTICKWVKEWLSER